MGIKVIYILKNKRGGEGCKMAWCIKALPTRPDELNTIPGTHIVEGENQHPPIVL